MTLRNFEPCLILRAGTQNAQGEACVPYLPLVKEPRRGTHPPPPPLNAQMGYICQPPIKQFLRILLSLAQHGLEPRDGGDRAGIGRPQRPAIHRMEEEIQGERGMQRLRIQLINEYRRMAGEVPRRLCVACRCRYGAMVQWIAIGALWRVLRNLPIPRKPLPSKAHSPIRRRTRASLRVLCTTARLDPLHPSLLL